MDIYFLRVVGKPRFRCLSCEVWGMVTPKRLWKAPLEGPGVCRRGSIIVLVIENVGATSFFVVVEIPFHSYGVDLVPGMTNDQTHCFHDLV